jgi:hypothetical protein
MKVTFHLDRNEIEEAVKAKVKEAGYDVEIHAVSFSRSFTGLLSRILRRGQIVVRALHIG